MGSQSGDSKREGYRFGLALVILVIFGLVLVVAMVGKYAEPQTLAGIFSGWIVAIIAFYFMDAASDRAVGLDTRRKLDQLSQDAEDSVDKGLKEKDRIIQGLTTELANLSNGISEYEQVVKDLESKLQGSRRTEPNE